MFWFGFASVVIAAISSGTSGGFKFDVPPLLTGLGPWVAVLTTATAAVTSHLAAARYDDLAVSYSATANRLASLRDVFQVDHTGTNSLASEHFVDDVEAAVSSENEAWRAAWNKDDTRKP